MLLQKIPPFLRILTAMILGLGIGAYTSTVFMGVDAIANAFVMLLQMTALPYISLSLIVGIGGLSATGLSSTFKQSLLFILISIAVVLFYIFFPKPSPKNETIIFYQIQIIS